MSQFDRSNIAGLLLDHFPNMGEKDAGGRIIKNASSEDWHALLDHVTGLNTSPAEQNATVFDQWRQALAKLGYHGVWDITPEHAERLKARGAQLLAEVAPPPGPMNIAAHIK